jgi:hypothetical protein
MLSGESNEIIRTICGQLIKEMLSAGIAKEHLWPQETDKQIYEAFPDASQPGGWNQNFQTYVDTIDTSPENS